MIFSCGAGSKPAVITCYFHIWRNNHPLTSHTKFPNLRNYINHGSKNGDDGAAKGFSIETLPAITSFKLGKLGEETKWCNCVNP